MMVNHITVITPRSSTGGTVGVVEQLVSIIFTQVSVAFLGNWLGFPVTTLGGVDPSAGAYFDVIKQFVLDMTSGQRNKQTYYPTKQDSAIVIDCKVASVYNGQAQNNPYNYGDFGI